MPRDVTGMPAEDELHEVLLTADERGLGHRATRRDAEHLCAERDHPWMAGSRSTGGFTYSSHQNDWWFSVEQLAAPAEKPASASCRGGV